MFPVHGVMGSYYSVYLVHRIMGVRFFFCLIHKLLLDSNGILMIPPLFRVSSTRSNEGLLLSVHNAQKNGVPFLFLLVFQMDSKGILCTPSFQCTE